MPIYEYQAANKDLSCPTCSDSFEAFQGINEEPIASCPQCGNKVRKTISLCRAVVVEGNEEDARVNRSIREYESAGMWSHAAELSDKHSEKTGDSSLKDRALENYKKAGYKVDGLAGSET